MSPNIERLNYILCNSHIVKSLASEKIPLHLHKHFGRAEQVSRSFWDDFETFFSSLLQPQPVVPWAEWGGERERRSWPILSSAGIVTQVIGRVALGLQLFHQRKQSIWNGWCFSKSDLCSKGLFVNHCSWTVLSDFGAVDGFGSGGMGGRGCRESEASLGEGP